MPEVEVKYDDNGALLRIRANKNRYKEDSFQVLEAARMVAYEHMIQNVPRSGPREKNPKQSPQRIADSIDPGDGVFYSPGGAGGGGYYDVRVGLADPPAHLEFVMEGTGIFGPRQSPIRPAEGNLMTFYVSGGWVSSEETKGQRPQREWFDGAFTEAKQVLASGIAALDF